MLQPSTSDTGNPNIVDVPNGLAGYLFLSFRMDLVTDLDVGLKTSDFSVSTSGTPPQKEKHLLFLPKDKSASSFPLSPLCVFKTLVSLAFPFLLDSFSLSPRLKISSHLTLLETCGGREQSTSANRTSSCPSQHLSSFSACCPHLHSHTFPKATADMLSAKAVTFSSLSVSHQGLPPLSLLGKQFFASITL